MSIWSRYILAKTIEEALEALASGPGPSCVVAGGTDLLLDLQQGRRPPVHTLVDITHIPELKALELRQTGLFIGAAAPLSAITSSTLVIEQAEAVAEACGLVGGPQVRNTATLGGNVAHALPAADGMIGLCAMGAMAEIASGEGRRMEAMLSLFKGPGQSTLQAGKEILVGFHIPLRQAGQASAFQRVMRPQGVALPILNVAAWVQRAGERLADIRIAVGPAGPMPQRAVVIEGCLKGELFDQAILERAVQLIRPSLHFRSSPQRASADYRYALCEHLLQEVVTAAWQRAASLEVA